MPPPTEGNTLQRRELILESGVLLSYYFIGQGPGLIIIHGALSYALTHLDLALSLSENFTVYLISRRGRGLSGSYPSSIASLSKTFGLHHSNPHPSYDPQMSAIVLDTDVSDIAALVAHTKTKLALGYSAGASILLETCSATSRYPEVAQIEKVILFEPALLLSDSFKFDGMDLSLMGRFEEEMASGETIAALATVTKPAKLGLKWFQASPRFILRILLGIVGYLEKREVQIRNNRRISNKENAGVKRDNEEKGATTMADLAQSLRHNFAAIMAMKGPASKYAEAGLGRKVLLLGGSESPAYLKEGAKALSVAMKGAKHIEISGVGHGVLATKMWGGKRKKWLREFPQKFHRHFSIFQNSVDCSSCKL